jgi:hypothetical protein
VTDSSQRHKPGPGEQDRRAGRPACDLKLTDIVDSPGLRSLGDLQQILVAATTVTVISKTNHQVLSSHHIDPDKNYWRNQNKNPGRWPGNL